MLGLNASTYINTGNKLSTLLFEAACPEGTSNLETCLVQKIVLRVNKMFVHNLVTKKCANKFVLNISWF